MKRKRGQVWDTLIPWLVALLVVVVVLTIYGIYSGKIQGALEFLKNSLRFKR